MEGKRLYKDIIYFMLAKELPGCVIGSMVTIIDADGRECLKCNGIEMDISLAKNIPIGLFLFILMSTKQFVNRIL